MRIGLISDTHDLLRPEAEKELAGVDRIIHCGDVCRPEILESLRELAPVSVVRGNCDHGAWADRIPLNDTWELDGLLVHAVHDITTIDIDPVAAGVGLVLFGHSHQPYADQKEGVLYVNPGSAGPRRFTLPVAMAHLEIQDGQFEVRPVTLL